MHGFGSILYVYEYIFFSVSHYRRYIRHYLTGNVCSMQLSIFRNVAIYFSPMIHNTRLRYNIDIMNLWKPQDICGIGLCRLGY